MRVKLTCVYHLNYVLTMTYFEISKLRVVPNALHSLLMGISRRRFLLLPFRTSLAASINLLSWKPDYTKDIGLKNKEFKDNKRYCKIT